MDRREFLLGSAAALASVQAEAFAPTMLPADVAAVLGRASIVERPYPTYPEYVLADLSTKSKLLNNGASGYNNTADVSVSDSPYGISTATELTQLNVLSRIAPAAAVSPVDLTGGHIALELQDRLNLGAVDSGAAQTMDRFNLKVYSAGAPGSPGSDSLTINSGDTGQFLIRKQSLAPDNASPSVRWHRIGGPTGNMFAVGAGASIAALIWAEANAIRSNSAATTVTARLGKIFGVPNPHSKPTVMLSYEDANGIGYSHCFGVRQANGLVAMHYPGAAQAIIGAVGRCTIANYQEMVAFGDRVGMQAVTSEDLSTLVARGIPQLNLDWDGWRQYLRAQIPQNGDSDLDASWFSTVTPVSSLAEFIRSKSRTIVRFDNGNTAGTPLPFPESWPATDRFNIRRLNGESAWTGGTELQRLKDFVDATVAGRGLGMIGWHFNNGYLQANLDAHDAFMPYLKGRVDAGDLVVTTMQGALYGTY